MGIATLCKFESQANMKSLIIGGARDPRRDMAGWVNLEDSGWVNRFQVNVATSDDGVFPPVKRFNVAEAFEPHRMIVSFGDVNNSGWTQRLSFFAWPEQHPGAIMVAVGEADQPHRCKFELGRHIGTSPEDQGWRERLVFWVPSDGIGKSR